MTPSDPNEATYDDARLAALYDHDNPPGEDHAFFRQVADEASATRIVDLGCGTGPLTVTLAGEGRTVVGVDPAEAMLAVARARPGGNAVTWRQGTAELIEPASADLVVMSGNVAMHLIGDVWHATLQRVAAGLTPGGRLAFETRNPALRAWEGWSHGPAERTTPAGRLLETETVTAPDADGVVLMRMRTEFLDTGAAGAGAVVEGTAVEGTVVKAEQRLQFRSAAQVRADLDAVGLTVERISGDWHRTPFVEATDRLMGVEARKA